MANERLLNKGTELILETAASSASVSDGAIRECDSDNRQSADNTGYDWGLFEFDTAAGGFSATPTAGAVINIYEQKINSDGNDAPDVASTYLYDYIGSMPVAPSDTQQFLSKGMPININGGKYWIEWLDGGAGTASIDAGWELRMTPATDGTA